MIKISELFKRSGIIDPIPENAGEIENIDFIIDNLPFMIAYVSKEMQFIHVNENYAKMYKREKSEIIGKNVKDLLPGKTFKIAEGYMKRVLKGAFLEYENFFSADEGGQKIVKVKYIPRYDKKGEVVAFLAVIEDITEEKRSLNKITQFGDVLESSLNEIYMFDSVTLKFENVNRGGRGNLGYSMDELKNMTPLDIKKEVTKEEFDHIISPLIKGEKSVINFNSKHFRKDGTYYNVEVNLQLSLMGTKSTFIAIIIDVTDRIRAEDELNKYRRELEQLVKERTIELEKTNEDLIIKNSDLERFHSATIERELRMKDMSDEMEELRKENNQLKKDRGKQETISLTKLKL